MTQKQAEFVGFFHTSIESLPVVISQGTIVLIFQEERWISRCEWVNFKPFLSYVNAQNVVPLYSYYNRETVTIID